MPDPLLSLCGLKKSFGGVAALKPFDLELGAGEILGLVGENGAGKSTLIKLLSGVHEPDSGRIQFSGHDVRFTSPRDARGAGIATIHQELECCPHLSVAENMLLGERWPRTAWGGIDWSKLHRTAREQLAAFELDLPTTSTLEQLTAAQKQDVAIASALAQQARLLILDEPTASLSEPEVKRLLSHLGRLKARGVSIVYVSHRLDEIFAITDRVAVLRDGGLVALHRTADVEVNRLIQDMLGRPLEQVYPRTRSGATARPPSRAGLESVSTPLLEVRGVTCEGMFHDVSFSLHKGEIVGLSGLVGAGRSELARALFGMYPVDSGEMRRSGRRWAPASPHAAVRAGLVYVPEERKRQGLVLDHRVRESISIGFTDRLSRLGLIDRRRENGDVERLVRTYDIRAANADVAIGALSGGNQQKALLARWLERDPEIVILDEPTRGVDVGAKAQIHGVIDRLAAEGKGILLISSDLPEVLGMSDRVLVMNRRTLCAELAGDEMTERNLILASSGCYEPPLPKRETP